MKKRTLALLTVMLMLFMLLPVQAADSATASTLRLERTEGTVVITNKNGKVMTVREGAKLYNGYVITTGEASYAFISLDDEKVIKLDADTVVELRQSGKDLEVALQSGKLFFNVPKALAPSETLNIRTSTMVTGIRGTSGIVSANSSGGTSKSEISLLTGEVQVQTSGGSNILSAGEKMQTTGTAATPGIVDIIVETLTLGDIRGFVAQEIAASPELKEKIEEQTLLDLQEIVDNADALLEEDEKLAEQERERLRKLLEEDAALLAAIQKIFVDPLFGTPEGTGVVKGDEAAIKGVNGTEPTPQQNAPVVPVDLGYVLYGAVTGADITAAFAAGHPLVTLAAGSVATIAGGTNVTIPPSFTLQAMGSVVLGNGAAIINSSSTTFILDEGATLSGSSTSYLINGFSRDWNRIALASDAPGYLDNPSTVDIPGTMHLYGDVVGVGHMINVLGAVNIYGHVSLASVYDNFSGTKLYEGASLSAERINMGDTGCAGARVEQETGTSIMGSRVEGSGFNFVQAAGATLTMTDASDEAMNFSSASINQQGSIVVGNADISQYPGYLLTNCAVTMGGTASVRVNAATDGAEPLVLVEGGSLALQTGNITQSGVTNPVLIGTEGALVSISNATITSTMASTSGLFLRLGVDGMSNPSNLSISNSTLNIASPIQNIVNTVNITNSAINMTSFGRYAMMVSGSATTFNKGASGPIMIGGGGSLELKNGVTVTGNGSYAPLVSESGDSTGVNLRNCELVAGSTGATSCLIDVSESGVSTNFNIETGAKLTKTGGSVIRTSPAYNLGNIEINGGTVTAAANTRLVTVSVQGGDQSPYTNKVVYVNGDVSFIAYHDYKEFMQFETGADPIMAIRASFDNAPLAYRLYSFDESLAPFFEAVNSYNNVTVYLDDYAEEVYFLPENFTLNTNMTIHLCNAVSLRYDNTSGMFTVGNGKTLKVAKAADYQLFETDEIGDYQEALSFTIMGAFTVSGAMQIGGNVHLTIDGTDGFLYGSVSMQQGSVLIDKDGEEFEYLTTQTATHGGTHTGNHTDNGIYNFN